MPIPTMVSENVSQDHNKNWNEKHILDIMMSIYLASITSKGHNDASRQSILRASPLHTQNAEHKRRQEGDWRGCVRHNQCLASWHWQPSPLALLLHKEGRACFFFNCTTEDAPPSTPSKGGYQEGFIREWNKKRNLASSSPFLSDDQNFQKPKEEICQKWWAPEDFETAPDLEFRIYPSMSSFFAKSLIANPYFHLFLAF